MRISDWSSDVCSSDLGAFLNDRRLRVSGRRNLQEAVFATGIPVTGLGGDHDRFLAQQRAFMENTAGVRRFGAAALDLAWVAAGWFDGFWEMRLKQWDIAAGLLLVKEAGGYVTDFAGRSEVLESRSEGHTSELQSIIRTP